MRSLAPPLTLVAVLSSGGALARLGSARLGSACARGTRLAAKEDAERLLDSLCAADDGTEGGGGGASASGGQGPWATRDRYVRAWHAAHGRWYFVDACSGASSWLPPEGVDPMELTVLGEDPEAKARAEAEAQAEARAEVAAAAGAAEAQAQAPSAEGGAAAGDGGPPPNGTDEAAAVWHYYDAFDVWQGPFALHALRAWRDAGQLCSELRVFHAHDGGAGRHLSLGEALAEGGAAAAGAAAKRSALASLEGSTAGDWAQAALAGLPDEAMAPKPAGAGAGVGAASNSANGGTLGAAAATIARDDALYGASAVLDRRGGGLRAGGTREEREHGLPESEARRRALDRSSVYYDNLLDHYVDVTSLEASLQEAACTRGKSLPKGALKHHKARREQNKLRGSKAALGIVPSKATKG